MEIVMSMLEAMSPPEAVNAARHSEITSFFVGFSVDNRGLLLLLLINGRERRPCFFATPIVSALCEDIEQTAHLRGWTIAYPTEDIQPIDADWDDSQNMKVVTGCRLFSFSDALIIALQLEGKEIAVHRWRGEHARGFAEGVLHEIDSGRFRDAHSETPPTSSRH
ncbi:hypothetical protein [Methylobacterium frigidaeris]|uniref:hypothetical protein n=1 Tax=Methylobacterium frigidaeris TaxID=2038277 RepID=UPI001EDDF32C|nr:hypothetical protein [Methylobacterium frigidaeris]